MLEQTEVSRVWYRIIFYKKISVGVLVLSDHFVSLKTSLILAKYQDPVLKDSDIKYFSDTVMKQLQQLVHQYEKSTPNRGAVLNKLPESGIPPFSLGEVIRVPELPTGTKEVFDDLVDKLYFETTQENS